MRVNLERLIFKESIGIATDLRLLTLKITSESLICLSAGRIAAIGIIFRLCKFLKWITGCAKRCKTVVVGMNGFKWSEGEVFPASFLFCGISGFKKIAKHNLDLP
ncbi:MAG: hypothetical protein ACI8SA_001848 [Dokdonia sp.]